MNNKCFKENEIKNIKLMCILIILLLIILILFHIEDLIVVTSYITSALFNNSEGVFDKNIMWTAIGTLINSSAIFAIVYQVFIRDKQNKYEFEKEQQLSRQYDFEVKVRELLDDVDPINILDVLSKCNEENYSSSRLVVNSYSLKCTNISQSIYWYYNHTFNGIQLSKMNEFIKTSNEIYNKNTFDDINELFSLYDKLKLYKTYTQLSNLTSLTEKEKKNFDELKEEFTDVCDINNKILNKSFEISKVIIDYRNNKWSLVEESAKEMIIERENCIKNMILK